MLRYFSRRQKSIFSSFLIKSKCFFSKMPYFREIALKLNITIPKLNEQIKIDNEQKCLVYGIRQVAKESQALKQVKDDTSQNPNSEQEPQKKNTFFDQQSMKEFEIHSDGKQNLSFQLVSKIASNLSLDICLVKQPTALPMNQDLNSLNTLHSSENFFVLNLFKFKQYIYREYYLKQLKIKSKRKYIESELTNQNLLNKSQWTPNTQGSYKNRIKTLQIGEKSQNHDLKTKQNQISRWLQQGQRTIKIVSVNVSDKSYKAIKKFCEFYQKQIQITQEQLKPQNLKQKPIIRYYALLKFEEEVEIDFDFINKRWRRREAEIKIARQITKSQLFNIKVSNLDYSVQKAYLAAFDKSGIPYPKEYDFLTNLDQAIASEGINGLINPVQENADNPESQNTDQDQPLTQKEKNRRDLQNRKILGLRTVEDILYEMEEIKSRSYLMEQFESFKFKQLQNQLTNLLLKKSKSLEKQKL